MANTQLIEIFSFLNPAENSKITQMKKMLKIDLMIFSSTLVKTWEQIFQLYDRLMYLN